VLSLSLKPGESVQSEPGAMMVSLIALLLWTQLVVWVISLSMCAIV
jgi:hypothetical protein